MTTLTEVQPSNKYKASIARKWLGELTILGVKVEVHILEYHNGARLYHLFFFGQPKGRAWKVAQRLAKRINETKRYDWVYLSEVY